MLVPALPVLPLSQKVSKPMSLTNLAPKVLQHLQLARATTFPAAADFILQEIQADKGDERTIRRRVYDILNVFLACDFIEKSKAAIQLKSPRLQTVAHVPGQEAVEAKRRELGRKLHMLVLYRCIISRNRHIHRPPGSVHLSSIFVAFPRSERGTACRSLDGKSLEVSSDAAPMYFSPMDVMDKLSFSLEERNQAIRAIGIDPVKFAL
jgi:hypothetical protein